MAQENQLQNNCLKINSDVLWYLTIAYSMVLVLANWFDARLIKISVINLDAGTLIFPFSFLLADLITEVYGYKYARRAIWCGFIVNIFFICYGILVTHLPSPSYATQNALFDEIVAINARVIVASCISYWCAEPVNALLLAKLKIRMHGNYLGLRYVLSTFIAAGIDSFVFGTIAFYGEFPTSNLINLILSMWLVKVGIEIIGLPVSISLTKKLKAYEQLDIYDLHTNFNPFNFQTGYSLQENKAVNLKRPN